MMFSSHYGRKLTKSNIYIEMMTPLPFSSSTNLHLQAEIESWTKIQCHYFCKIAWAIVEDSSWLILFKNRNSLKKTLFLPSEFPKLSVSILYKPTTLNPIISFLSDIPYALETSLMFSCIHHSLYSHIFILTWPFQLKSL